MTEIEFPKVFQPLFKPKRYKILYGGRGSAKSWSVARALLIQGTEEPLRILCAREVQRTIADSVHRLLTDQIAALGLQDFYTAQETSIVGRNGCEFLFAGLRAIDAAKIKSYEGVDIAWVEEAQTLSKKSREILAPTIRAEQSEIWMTFNPELDTDDVYQYFVAHTPPDAWVQKVTWRDNPWFPEVLKKEREHLLKTDPEAHEHVWEGKPRTVVEGAIYAKEVMAMMEEKRICRVPYDPSLPVHTIWDLGWNDAMTIILAQRRRSEVDIIGYIEDNQRTLAEYVADLNKKRYVWGTDWLPHDGANKDHKTGKSTQELMKKLGRTVKIIPKLSVEEGIRAARMMFPRVYADEANTERLITCLKRYRRALPESTGEPGHPVHDEYSHGADAYRGLAVIVDQIRNEKERPTHAPVAAHTPLDTGIGM